MVNCCTYVCSYPNTLDNSIYFLEGVVTGYGEYEYNFNRRGRNPELRIYGNVQITISKKYHSPKEIDEVTLIPLGSDGMCGNIGLSEEIVINRYHLGDTITFVAPVSGIILNSQVNLEFDGCFNNNMFYPGRLSNLKECDIELKRRTKIQFMSEQQKLYNVPNNLQYSDDWKRQKAQIDLKKEKYRQSYENVVPEGLQFYLNAGRAKRKLFNFKRNRLLKSMIWSHYFRNYQTFVKNYKIGRRMERKLQVSLSNMELE